MKINHDLFGNLIVKNCLLPLQVKDLTATYTSTGTILLSFTTPDDPQENGWINVAVIKDTGEDFKIIYQGELKQHPKANGIRWMVFSDGKRVLLGDYVLHCSPNIDNCTSVKFKPVIYPDWLMDSKGLWFHWSEVIIAPDNKTISWTTLGEIYEGVYIGTLCEEIDHFTIHNIKNISSTPAFLPDPFNPDYFLPQHTFGGEVKQFVHFGTGISVAGSSYGIAGPNVQHLRKNEKICYYKTPGYDETLIFSPDEKHGVVMSTHFSPKTNFDILGLVPRPLQSHILSALAMPVYGYAVSDVRTQREGNIGPVLIDILLDQQDVGHEGVCLNDPSEPWVYYSPISWHPDSTKAMWIEKIRLSDLIDYRNEHPSENTTRIRIMHMLDKEPSLPASAIINEDNDPNAEAMSDQFNNTILEATDISKIIPMSKHQSGIYNVRGKHSGSVQFEISISDIISRKVHYNNYSDDGLTYYSGAESVRSPLNYFGITQYESNLEVSGQNLGAIKLKLTFDNSIPQLPTKLVIEGNDKEQLSYGFAYYNDQSLSVNDLL